MPEQQPEETALGIGEINKFQELVGPIRYVAQVTRYDIYMPCGSPISKKCGASRP